MVEAVPFVPRTTSTKQPFPCLPAYPVAVTVLTYYGWDVAVYSLLSRLSKTAQTYREQHSTVLLNTLQQLRFRKLPYLTLTQEPFKPKKRDSDKYREFEWPNEGLFVRLSQANAPFREIGITSVEAFYNYAGQIEGLRTGPAVQGEQKEEALRSVKGSRYVHQHEAQKVAKSDNCAPLDILRVYAWVMTSR